MLFPSTILLSALLAGQITIAAYIPVHPRAEIITRTEVRTVYSTKVVFASPSPSAAGTNSADGLPLAPSISRLSIPLSSILAVNPINGLPVPTVRKTTTAKKPTSTKKPTPTKKPAANSSAAAGIAAILSHQQQRPKQSSTKAAAAAGIASVLAQLPKGPKASSTKSTAAGIVIVPVTLVTTVKPKAAATITKQATLKTASPVFTGKHASASSLLAMLSAAQD